MMFKIAPYAIVVVAVLSGATNFLFDTLERHAPIDTASRSLPAVTTMPSCIKREMTTGLAIAYWPPRADGSCHFEDVPSRS